MTTTYRAAGNEGGDVTAQCVHANVASEVCDQTLGVACTDCKTLLAWCWGDNHLPESLWNRVAAVEPDANACALNRPNVCALCGEDIKT